MFPATLSAGFLPDKVLLVTAERVGDALFCTPGIALLKECLPALQLDILAFHPLAADVYTHNPHVRKIHVSSNKHAIRQLAKQYPLVINLTYEFQKYLVKLPTQLLSIGFPDKTQHRAQQVVDYIQSLLDDASTFTEPSLRPYAIYPSAEHFQQAEELLSSEKVNLEHDILVGVQLGCHRVARRGWKFWSRTRHQHRKVWPLENYIALAHRLRAANPRVKVVLTGSQSEAFLAKLFLREVPWAVSLIGKTSLLELAALMDYLKVLLTHDTGTLHIACARALSLVALFGPTAVAFTGPYPLREEDTVIVKSNMSDISVEEVSSALLAKINES
jgi:ADP-heptose:LPS heptosyltransferase